MMHRFITSTFSSTSVRNITLFLFFFCILDRSSSFAQVIKQTVVQDSTRPVEIIHASHFRQLWFNDSTELQTLSGNAAVKQNETLLEGDSIVINKRLGIIEVFGHAHVNDADTVQANSEYLRYESNLKMAYLKQNVKLTDGKAIVLTNNLEYNVETGVGIYKEKGKVITGKTILTSEQGTYYTSSKDIYFEGDVRMKDPQYNMTSNRLRYNTEQRKAYFISPTHIVTQNGIIDTRNGFYNMQTGEAIFSDGSKFTDKDQEITGNSIAVDEKNNVIQIEENGKFIDKKQQVIVTGNQLLIDRKNNSFLATRKPVMILYDKGDSTFINADTLFSGKRIERDTATKIPSSKDTIQYFLGFHHVRIYNDSVQAVSDSLHYSTSDSLMKLTGKPICWNGNTQISGDTMHLQMANQQPDQLHVFYNALVVHLSGTGIFDQMQGKKLDGFFTDGELKQIKTVGSPAESIFYPQNEDSAYIGMNRSQSQWIEFFFKNKEVETIKYSNDVSGKMYPMGQAPGDQKKLKGFFWQPERRPVSKFVLFQ